MTRDELLKRASDMAASYGHSETELEAQILRLAEELQSECDPFVHVEAAKWSDSIAQHAAIAILKDDLAGAMRLISGYMEDWQDSPHVSTAAPHVEAGCGCWPHRFRRFLARHPETP